MLLSRATGHRRQATRDGVSFDRMVLIPLMKGLQETRTPELQSLVLELGRKANTSKFGVYRQERRVLEVKTANETQIINRKPINIGVRSLHI